MIETTLFPGIQSEAVVPTGPFAEVAIERSLDQVLDYGIPAGLVSQLQVGHRVKVPLGRRNKPVHGYVVRIRGSTTLPHVKPVLAIDDARVLLLPPWHRD